MTGRCRRCWRSCPKPGWCIVSDPARAGKPAPRRRRRRRRQGDPGAVCGPAAPFAYDGEPRRGFLRDPEGRARGSSTGRRSRSSSRRSSTGSTAAPPGWRVRPAALASSTTPSPTRFRSAWPPPCLAFSAGSYYELGWTGWVMAFIVHGLRGPASGAFQRVARAATRGVSRVFRARLPRVSS